MRIGVRLCKTGVDDENGPLITASLNIHHVAAGREKRSTAKHNIPPTSLAMQSVRPLYH